MIRNMQFIIWGINYLNTYQCMGGNIKMINNSFNVELLYVFAKVCELKSINKSSIHLSMTQPAISKKIKQLENYYDKELFIRTPQGMELTPVGYNLYKKSKHFIAEFEKMNVDIFENKIKISDIKLGSLDSISSHTYSSFFVDFLSELKTITITNNIFDLIYPFNEKKLDLILIDSEFENKIIGKISKIQLFEEPYYLVYSQCNKSMEKLSEFAIIKATQLNQLRIIMYPKYCPIHQRIIEIYEQLNISLPEIVEIDYSESTIAMVSKSEFVTILPKSLAINKVTQNINKLTMKQLGNEFIRHVSVFSHNKETLNLVHNLLQ